MWVRVPERTQGQGYIGGERDRIIARARAMARRLGLDAMSDEALYDSVVQKRASLNRDAARALAANRGARAARRRAL